MYCRERRGEGTLIKHVNVNNSDNHILNDGDYDSDNDVDIQNEGNDRDNDEDVHTNGNDMSDEDDDIVYW